MNFKLSILCSAILLSSSAMAKDFVSGSNERSSLDLTIYNGNLAMVKDVRKGIEEESLNIIVDNVSDQIIPETLDFKGGIVKEFNYSFDLTSHDSMLDAMIGQAIVVQSDADAYYSGTLLSTNGNRILMKSAQDDQIVSLPKNNGDWSYYFKEIPENLTSSPTLEVQAMDLTGNPLEISYLSRGLSWTANYVATLSDSELMTLNSWLTINNQTSTPYRGANVSVVAGSPNMNQPNHAVMRKNMEFAAMSSDALMPEQGNVGEYKIYSIPFETDIAAKEQKQLALFSLPAVKYTKTYEHTVGRAYYGSTEPFKAKANVFVEVENNEDNGLGLPLPSGAIRFYEEDSHGDTQFIGENRIKDLSVGESSRFRIGEAFDVTIEEKIGYESRLSTYVTKRNYVIDINNAKDIPVETNIVMPLNANMIILDSTEAYGKIVGKGLVFPVRVDANSASRLEYTVQYSTSR